MPKDVVVPLNWTVVAWHPSETWGKVLLPRLVEEGVARSLLKRSVYVVRLAGNFAISYPRGESPAVYVGEGSFGARIQCHRDWAAELEELVGKFSFELCVATPRVRNNEEVHKDCEAVILQRFGQKFGTAPLWNKQFENRRFPRHVYSREKIDYAIRKRSGSKYEWALQPMKSSIFYQSYMKTHL